MDFRQFVAAVDAQGELLRVPVEVDPLYELGALLQQGEARRKAVLFESVKSSAFPVAGGLLTTPSRYGLALGELSPASYTIGLHTDRVQNAIANPLPHVSVTTAACKQNVLTGSQA